MTDELKPVPCGCGGEAKAWEFMNNKWYVKCPKCSIGQMFAYRSEAEAVTAWNMAMSGSAEKSSVVERTAKVIEHDGVVTMDGKKYHHMEYLCENCKKKVLGGDSYCSHCGCRLDWNEDIPMEYFESGGI